MNISKVKKEKMTIKDRIKFIDAEILWCEQHPDRAFSKEYRKGFINGLIQAKHLLTDDIINQIKK